MKPSEIKKLISDSLDHEYDSGEIPRILEGSGVTYDFRDGFTEKVVGNISGAASMMKQESDLTRSLNYAFYRIALAGAAAIIILMLSIFIMQESFSFDSFLGIGDSYDESIFYLITGI